jgi:hypothetical protein
MLDMTCHNFGIHDDYGVPNQVRQIFQGIHEVRDGYAWVSEKPGCGVEINEAAAAKLPAVSERPGNRLPDGSYDWASDERTPDVRPLVIDAKFCAGPEQSSAYTRS